MELAKKHIDRLSELKRWVEESQEYFKDNVDRYNEFMRFVFDSSLTQLEVGALETTGKPTIEFNILEAYISRLRGEFAKQQPAITVRAADGIPLAALTTTFTETISVVESYLRNIFFDGTNDMMEYNIYSDLLAGGFSCMKVYTEYVNEMSFEQRICVDRVFDPTLVGFDPIARTSHKGDGRYCFELYPMTRKKFEDEFGKAQVDEMQFTRQLQGFSWSFKNEREDIILVCDLYEKKTKKEKILKLSNGHTVLEKQYKKFIQGWEERGFIEQPPLPVGEPRMTTIEVICRYRFCENRVLDYKETDYKFLPLVFVDGNSVIIHEAGSSTQMTRPYVYHAQGIQRLKNFAGESLANELENTIQHKFIVALESIPDDDTYLVAYQNVQKADTLMYNHFLDTNNPNVTLPPPREVVRTPIPPEISNTFRISDEMTQTILGTYEQSMQRDNLSGVAIARGAIQGNSASSPYLIGFIKGLNRVAQIIVDLIPKYYRTPRTLPIVHPSGKRDFVEINKKGSLYLDYDPNHLQIKVEAGVNFAMQKQIALETVIHLMQVSPTFATFMNQHGLQMLLDNIEIRGVDALKEHAEKFEKQQQQQQQQAQQMQMQQMQMQQQIAMKEAEKQLSSPTPEQVSVMELQEKAKVDAANISIKAKDSEIKFLELMSKIKNQAVERELKAAQIDAEQVRSAVEMSINLSKHIGE